MTGELDLGPIISRERVIAQIRDLGIPAGTVLVVHTSFRAVRPVEGGPRGLIEALVDALGPQGTLVMPSMSGSRNSEPYDPATSPTRGMGIVAETFRRMPGVLRSGHPTSSFAALGLRAAYISAPQPLAPVHGLDSPVGRIHDLDGYVLLLGVGHPENTTIHLAESIAGVPYRVEKWATIREAGRPKRVTFEETDHCCRNFRRVDTWLRDAGMQRDGMVGHAHARLARSRDIVRIVTEQLRENPTLFLCPCDADCEECEIAWRSVASQ